LIRKDLKSPYKFVQGAHAVAAQCLQDGGFLWDNETLVFLDVEDQNRLELAQIKLEDQNFQFIRFREPDLNYQLTAIACASEDEKFFDQWQLAS
jgi:hypothetical protein